MYIYRVNPFASSISSIILQNYTQRGAMYQRTPQGVAHLGLYSCTYTNLKVQRKPSKGTSF